MNATGADKAVKRRPLLLRVIGWAAGFFFKVSLVAVFVAAGVLIGGFAKFSNNVSKAAPPKTIPKAEAIVVLTGGAERISVALDLLARNEQLRLLISGVNPLTGVEALSVLHPDHAHRIACCVDLDTASTDTIGNAEETRKWMAERGYASLILVTSAYHMSRSQMEFARQMPGIVVYSWPVALADLGKSGWWRNPDTLHLMISEYIKYVGAWSRDFVQPGVFDTVRASMFGKAG